MCFMIFRPDSGEVKRVVGRYLLCFITFLESKPERRFALTTRTTNNSTKRIAMYCSEPSITEACSASCDASVTCEDTNGWMFELIFFGNSVGCDWFTKRNTARRTGKYCVESGSFFDAEIADKCVASFDASTNPLLPLLQSVVPRVLVKIRRIDSH